MAADLSSLSDSDEAPGPARALICLVAALVVVLAPWFGYLSIEREVGVFVDRLSAAAQSTVAPQIRQQQIPRALVRAAEGLLGRGDLALNYLTLRNASGVVLVSLGRFERAGGFLPAAQARRLRGLLYRAASDDGRLSLVADGRTVGTLDFGISTAAAATQAILPLLLALLAAGLAAWALCSFLPGALGWWRAWRAGAGARSEPQRAPITAAQAPAAQLDSEPARAASSWLEEIELGLVTIDHRGRVRSANAAARRLLQRDGVDVLGQSFETVIRFTDGAGQAVDGPLERCLQGNGGPSRERLLLERGQGGRLPVEACAAPAGAGGAAAALLFWDVAGDALARDEFQDRALVAETALAGVREAVAVVAADGMVRMVNPAWAELSGMAAESLAGMPLAWMMPEPFAEQEPAAQTELAARFTGPGGSGRALTVDVVPVGRAGVAWLLLAGGPSPVAPAPVEPGQPAGDGLRDALRADAIELLLWPVEGPGGAVAAAYAEPLWSEAGGAELAGRGLLGYAVAAGLGAEMGGWMVNRLGAIYAGWRDIGLSAVPLLWPVAAGELEKLAKPWSAARRQYQLPAGSLIAVAPEQHDAPADGLGLALETDFSHPPGIQSETLLVLAPDLVAGLSADDAALEAVKALAAFARTHRCRLIAGPVADAAQQHRLASSGVKHLYGPLLGKPMRSRPFGHYLASHTVVALSGSAE